MGDRPPGPLCVTRVGQDWIDQGTSCLSRSAMPGPLGQLIQTVFAAVPDPFRAKYDVDHVYSAAPEAAVKRAIDLSIIGGDYKRGNEVRIDNEAYLKRLIEEASGGKRSVPGVTSGLEFFIIRGGAEGFLPSSLRGQDASNVTLSGATTSGAKSLTFRFDDNDLLVVFDSKGSLVSSARLERPLFITGMWTQKTADKVYNSWADKKVFVYKNTNFSIPYLGLGVEDGFRGKSATVDMHKQEATNGCIFIVDPKTPALGDANLGKFEPQLIQDILSKTGISVSAVKSKISLGVMRVIEIK